jgi:hypothetical protein
MLRSAHQRVYAWPAAAGRYDLTICPKIADDFVVKSDDNGCDLEPGGLPGASRSDHHREELS